mmetsp:Transcript_22862/g.25438  ORF Transcript_22862/g.25438 Transcript_22862/m.25438 type:complete len:344 (+) Transcript_22862:77-1108(+)
MSRNRVSKTKWVDPSKIGSEAPLGVNSIKSSRMAYQPVSPIPPAAVEGYQEDTLPPCNPELFTGHSSPYTTAQDFISSSDDESDDIDRPKVVTPEDRIKAEKNQANLNIIVFAVLAVIVAMAFMFYQYSVITSNAKLMSITWKHTIQPQEYTMIHKEGFDLPIGGGVNVERTEERVYSESKVKTGTQVVCEDKVKVKTKNEYSHTTTKCYDDGTCEDKDVFKEVEYEEIVNECKNIDVFEKVPTYRPYYYYTTWQWVDSEPIIASGMNDAPYWPQYFEDHGHKVRYRSSNYKAKFIVQENDKPYDYDLGDENAYMSLLDKNMVGAQFKVRRNAFSITSIIGVL